MKSIFNRNPYDFSLYRLSASLPAVRVFIVISSALNVLLLIPDIINIRGSAAIAVWALRLTFAAACVLLFTHVRKFHSFKTLSRAIAAMELFAEIVFLWIFHLYTDPDLLIQLLGIMVIILVVFLVPNSFPCMAGVSIMGAAGFLAISFDPFANTDTGQYVASAVYLAAEIVLCAVFGLVFLNYQRREYATNMELQKMYATDPLTQVGNRVRLEKEADKWLAFCRRHGLPLSLVLMDIDNMKLINDQHGHLSGDATICEFVRTICGHLRKNDVCVRWGGDEFVLLLPGTDVADAESLVERIRGEIENHAFPTNTHITCSFGISCMQQGPTLEDMLRLADVSMYQAKKQGKNIACGADSKNPVTPVKKGIAPRL